MSTLNIADMRKNMETLCTYLKERGICVESTQAGSYDCPIAFLEPCHMKYQDSVNTLEESTVGVVPNTNSDQVDNWDRKTINESIFGVHNIEE